MGISRNFTEGGETPFLVLCDDFVDRMDLAGGGRDPTDDCDDDLSRTGLKCRSAASPKMASRRPHDEPDWSVFDQYELAESDVDVVLPLDSCL